MISAVFLLLQTCFYISNQRGFAKNIQILTVNRFASVVGDRILCCRFIFSAAGDFIQTFIKIGMHIVDGCCVVSVSR